MPETGLDKILGAEAVLESQRAIGRLEGKMDSLILQLTEHIRKDEIAWMKVSSLEKKIVWASGVIAAITFVFTTGIASILKKIGVM